MDDVVKGLLYGLFAVAVIYLAQSLGVTETTMVAFSVVCLAVSIAVVVKVTRDDTPRLFKGRRGRR
jgi:hypothetical protein